MRKRFEVLDSFRGLCALAVVVFHMHLVNTFTELDFFKGSFVFVEFFFVLSGFVLAHSYGFKNDLKFIPFIRARFFRLYPLHIFMLIVLIFLELGKLLASSYFGFDFNNPAFSNTFSPSEILPNLLLIQSWVSFANSISFNAPAWSISIEFYLYALFFFSVIIFNKFRVLAWFVISFLVFFNLYNGFGILSYEAKTGISCFFGGAFFYYFYKKISHIRFNYCFASIVETFLIVTIVYLVQIKSVNNLFYLPATFFLTVLFFAFESGYISELLKVKLFKSLGKFSYSIYMIHFAIIYCVMSFVNIMEKFFKNSFLVLVERTPYLDFGGAIINNLVALTIVIVVIFLSRFTYNYIEVQGNKLNIMLSNKMNNYAKKI